MMNSDRPHVRPLAWLARTARSLAAVVRPPQPALPRILVVIEGPNDIEFLRRISAILHREDPSLPDLADMEHRHTLVFAPTGGADLSSAFRFAGLNLPEFHVLDRDLPPATQSRQQVAAMVNSRARCQAVITSKRNLENYLHWDAILEASGISIVFSDEDDVPELIARQMNERHEPVVPWIELPHRSQTVTLQGEEVAEQAGCGADDTGAAGGAGLRRRNSVVVGDDRGPQPMTIANMCDSFIPKSDKSVHACRAPARWADSWAGSGLFLCESAHALTQESAEKRLLHTEWADWADSVHDRELGRRIPVCLVFGRTVAHSRVRRVRENCTQRDASDARLQANSKRNASRLERVAGHTGVEPSQRRGQSSGKRGPLTCSPAWLVCVGR